MPSRSFWVLGIIVGLVINFANLQTDFQDLRDFHRGYLGRQMLIREGRLSSRFDFFVCDE